MPDAVYQGVLYYAKSTLCNKRPERLKILSINRKQFHMTLNGFLFDTPYSILMICKPCIHFI